MNKNQLRNSILIGVCGLVPMTIVQAGMPVWTFAPVAGYPPSITVSTTETATIKYTVTNQSHKSHTLQMKPIQGIIPSECTPPLGYHQSCTLSLNIIGSALKGSVTGGPVLCDQSNPLQCYQPSQTSSLAIRLTQQPPVQQYTVTPSAGANGSINPGTTQVVNSGSTIVFTATPDVGYGVNQWLLDGVVVQTGGTTYTLNNITSNHNVDVTFSLTISVLVGFSFNSTHTNNLPLAYTSNDSGSNWTLAPNFVLPQAQGELFGVNCSGSLCIAVGESFDNTFNNSLPLAYTSNDSGSTWTLGPIFTLPGSQTQGELFSVGCVGNICTAVGISFNNTFTNNLPLVYTSSDSGNNWTLSPDLTLPSGAAEGFLLGVDCRSNSCTAIGTSDNGSANSSQPLAYTSNDGGINWTASLPFILPGSQTQGELFGITCIGNNCTAVGESLDSSSNNQLPLAYTSVDSGGTWTLSSSFSLPGSQPEGLLNAVTCISNKCIAVGESFQGGFVNTLPLAYTSTDNGASWTMTSPLPLPSGQTEGILTTVTCTGNLCYAAGLSSQAGLTNQLPLVYLSNDGGITWVLSTPLTLPAAQTQGELTGGASGKGF